MKVGTLVGSLALAGLLGLTMFGTAQAGGIDVRIGIGHPGAVYYDSGPRYYHPAPRVVYRYYDRRPVHSYRHYKRHDWDRRHRYGHRDHHHRRDWHRGRGHDRHWRGDRRHDRGHDRDGRRYRH